jgi:aldehyde dehydrogenase (NAD+)
VSAGVITSIEPARPDRTVAEVDALDRAELAAAIERGAVGASGWAQDAAARARALQGWAEAIEADAGLAELVAREVGKPIREAGAEVTRAVALIRYYAQAAYDPIGEMLPSAEAGTHLLVRRLPLGVVTAICPWNFPLAIPAWKLAPALAYGNAVIFKPASTAIGVGRRLIELARPAIPDEVLVFAPMHGADAVALLDDDRVQAVSFTGSSAVGRGVIARVSARGARVQAEMGGHNPSIILEDADLAHAADTIAYAATSYAGQKCTATSRVIVDRRVATAFVDELVSRFESLSVGDPLSTSTDVGPLIDEPARIAVDASVQAAVGRGARPIVGADMPAQPGWYYRPTLLAIDSPDDPFLREETFGPAAAVIVAEDDEEAIAFANGTQYGLAAAVFSADATRAMAVADRLEAGMVRINASTTGADFWAPFGGERASGYGPKEQGRAAREFYTKTRTLTVAASVPTSREPN